MDNKFQSNELTEEALQLLYAKITAVPEPSTYGMLGAGALAGVAFVRRRKRAIQP